MIEGILYCNDGDWVESLTALAESETGELSIVRWKDIAWHSRSTIQRVAAEPLVVRQA